MVLRGGALGGAGRSWTPAPAHHPELDRSPDPDGSSAA